MLKKTLKYYLISCGLILHVGAVFGIIYALGHYALTPRQFLVKVVEKSGIDSPLLISFFEPTAQHSDHFLDGQITSQHPRILLPEIASMTQESRVALFQLRASSYKNKGINAPALPCNQNNLSALSTCWLATGNPQKFNLALERLLNFKVETPDTSAIYGNGWQLAFNYDLLSTSPEISKEQHAVIQSKLETAVVEYLRVLDEDSASLWHGRLSLSSNAWLCAVMLNADTEKQQKLIARAQGHFLETVQSVAITEAWPEGYNYWINNRAFYFALAASAYINGLENSQHTNDIKKLLVRVGYWHIYATRPDNKIQGYADEGPRVDLKDETRRVIDIIASTTGNQELSSFSFYLQKLHGVESYYRDYRWGFHLFNDPKLLPTTASGSFKDFRGTLPEVDLFSRNASNALFLRSDWSPKATYLTYRAGHNFTHHGHYDAGHFTLFKGQPLAVNSSNYGDFKGPNRLNYSLRSIAKNTLLIQRPGEKVKPNRFFTDNVADGGQRITLPTGSSIQSSQHWQDNLYQNQHLEAAELEQFTNTSNYTYIQSNLTPAYNNTSYDETGSGGKVAQVKRALFYLKNEDLLLIHDRIQTTDPTYRSKWLLHSINKPQTSGEKTIKGSADNGIISSSSKQVLIQQQDSLLKITALFPNDAELRLIGGDNFRHYVEVDGDDSTLDGINMSAGVKIAPWFENAAWRTEIFSPKENTDQHFLIALAPSIGSPHPITAHPLTTSDKNQYGALLDNSAVIFTHTRGQFEVTLPPSINQLYLIGPLQQPRKILLNGSPIKKIQQQDSISQIQLPASALNKSLHIEL